MKNYKAVILAGGKGTRLYPITYEIPKPLLPIQKKPIINYLVDLFLEYGIKDIAVLISDKFTEEFVWWKKRYYPSADLGSSFQIKLIEETEPLGTFGGLYHLKEWIGQSPFFLTNGDELKKIDLDKMAQFHTEKLATGTIALVEVSDPQNYGVVVCENGIVKNFLEKPQNPPSNRISSGFYLLSPEVLNNHPGPIFTMIEKDIFPQLAKEQKLAGFNFNGKWMDTGTFERYEYALKHWLS